MTPKEYLDRVKLGRLIEVKRQHGDTDCTQDEFHAWRFYWREKQYRKPNDPRSEREYTHEI